MARNTGKKYLQRLGFEHKVIESLEYELSVFKRHDPDCKFTLPDVAGMLMPDLLAELKGEKVVPALGGGKLRAAYAAAVKARQKSGPHHVHGKRS